MGTEGEHVEHEVIERPDGADWMRESQVFWDSDRGGDVRVWVDVCVLSPGPSGGSLASEVFICERPGGPVARSPRWLRWLRRAKS